MRTADLQHVRQTTTGPVDSTGRALSLLCTPPCPFPHHHHCFFPICRSLRKLEDLHLQRLRVDIKDFQPAGVQGLSKGRKPWVTTGKHLCGAATDFTLRCCVSSMQHARSNLQQSPQQESALSLVSRPSAPERARTASSTPGNSRNDHGGSHMQSAEQPKRVSMPEKQHLMSAEQGSSRVEAAGMAATQGTDGCSSDAPSGDAAEDDMGCRSTHDQVSRQAGVQGFAVATCCHHRCSWQHYVGKPLFRHLELTPDEFEIISWMTGAVALSCFYCTKTTSSYNLVATLLDWVLTHCIPALSYHNVPCDTETVICLSKGVYIWQS